MSEALYQLGGLRFWSEDEIELREMFQARAVSMVKRALLNLNAAWSFARTEGPCLSPRNEIAEAYSSDDLFVTNHRAFGEYLCLRAETTASSYAWAKMLRRKPPFCVWQSGKSFRREMNDGASASKLRFNEFWQLEFQCVYALSTKANYRDACMDAVALEIERFTSGLKTRFIESDRLPAYSESTRDILLDDHGEWREVASCSIRTDYGHDMRVCEIAIGLDRVVEIAGKLNRRPATES